jgi:cobalt-zinc-cadmium efflux system membrane fusion protein
MNKHTQQKVKQITRSTWALALLLALASCSSGTDTPAAAEPAAQTPAEGTYELSNAQFESSGMQLGKLAMKTFHEVVKATGMFDVPPENRASVGSYFGGTVTDIRLLPGERVKKGQLLFTLENPDFVQMQQEYLESQGQLTNLKADYERQKNLLQDQVTSQKNFLKAEADYTVTRVKVASLARKLSLMNINPNTLSLENIQTTVSITSPINGYVTQVNINRGTFLPASQSAITIVDTDHLHLELNIFEKDLPHVRIGQTIRFSIQEDQRSTYTATVHLVNKTVDPENRTIGIHGHLTDENLSSLFSPGMYVEADINTSSSVKAALPEEALVEVEGKYYVLALQSQNNGYTLVKKEVKAGQTNDGFVEILNPQDFEDNTQFLISGAFNLISE